MDYRNISVEELAEVIKKAHKGSDTIWSDYSNTLKCCYSIKDNILTIYWRGDITEQNREKVNKTFQL